MNPARLFLFATFALCFIFPPFMRAQQTSAERVSQIQAALRAEKVDGWLFYDFRHSDPLAYRILKLDEDMAVSRRWFYYIPASGEPVKVVMSIEQFKLDSLPGKKLIYRGWQELHQRLREMLGTKSDKAKRIAMQYSPMNDIPYMSRVDAGTIELIHSLGAEIVSSAELVQQFEAVWSPEQLQMHIEASDKMHRIFFDAFGEIARRIRADEPTTEYDIEQFILRRWHEEGMGSEHDDAIVSVNANTANPHYVPTKEKRCRSNAAISFCSISHRNCESRMRFSPIKRGPVTSAKTFRRNTRASSTSCAKRAIPPSTSCARMCRPANRFAARRWMMFHAA